MKPLRRRNPAIRARLGSDKESAVIELRGTRLDAVFLLSGIVSKLSEATSIPINRLLEEVKGSVNLEMRDKNAIAAHTAAAEKIDRRGTA